MKQFPIRSPPCLTNIHLRFSDLYLCLRALIPFVFQSPRPLLRKVPLVLNLSSKARQKKRRYRSFPRLEREEEFFRRISSILVNKEGKMSIDYSPAAACRGCKNPSTRKALISAPPAGTVFARTAQRKTTASVAAVFRRWKDSVDSPGSSSPTRFFNSSDFVLRAKRIAKRN